MIGAAGYRIGSLLHEGPIARVWQGQRRSDGLSVVFKEYHGIPGEVRRARCEREHAMLSRLDSPYVVRGVEVVGHGESALLVSEEVVGCSALSARLSSGVLSPRQAIDVAIAVGEALAHLHRRGLVHCDIKPANILTTPDYGRIVLVDFGDATELAMDAQATLPEGELCGSPHYLSPEQTGCASTPLDYRTDYYGLGCTLYHALVGAPPFADESEFAGILHAQLARVPASVRSLRSDVPHMLSALIAKLLAKHPDGRYQGARGLLHDLRHCLEVIAGRADPQQPLGVEDHPERLLFSGRLHGREAAEATLAENLERAIHGGPRLVVLKGASGSGKSALVRSLRQEIHVRGGRYAEGKFDMLQLGSPYAGLLAIFRQLLAEWTCLPSLQQRNLIEAIKRQEGLPTLLHLVPEVRRLPLTSAPAPVAPAPGETGRVQCEAALGNALQAFASLDGPLVLFLDDMQWADAGTIAFLQWFMGSDKGSRLLCITAHRSPEVGAAHPWGLALERLQRCDLPLAVIEIDGLTRLETQAFLQDCLNRPAELEALAELVHRRTAGNPYFLRQFLHLAVQRGHLWLHGERGTWCWDLPALSDAHSADNVVDILLSRLQHLSRRAQAALGRCSAIADRFDLATAAAINRLQPRAMAEVLEEGLRAGLLHSRAALGAAAELSLCNTHDVHYRFAHDRVRSVLYGSLGSEAAGIHSALFESLRARPRDPADDDCDRRLAYHGALGRSHIQAAEAVEQLALASHRAGVAALRTGLYREAAQLLGRVRPWLLEVGRIAPHRALVFDTELSQLRALRLVGEWDAAWALAPTLVPLTPTERAQLSVEKVYLSSVSRDLEETLALILSALAEHGLKLRRDPSRAQVVAEMLQTKLALSRVGIENVRTLPPLTDEVVLCTQVLLGISVVVTYQLGLQSLYVIMAARMLRIGLQHGLSPAAVEGLSLYAFLEMLIFRKYERARRISEEAMAIVAQYDEPRVVAHVHCTHAFGVEHWTAGSRGVLLDRARDSYVLAARAGDSHMASATLSAAAHGSVLLGAPLQEAESICEQLRDHYNKVQDDVRATVAQELIALCKNLREGRSALLESPFSLKIDQVPGLHRYYGYGEYLLVDLLWHRPDRLEQHIAGLVATRCFGKGGLMDASEPLWLALAEWRLSQAGGRGKAALRKALARHRKRLQSWAQASPALAEPGFVLVCGLCEHAQGNAATAQAYLESAETAAQLRQQWHVGGLSMEVALEIALQRANLPLAMRYCGRALRCYLAWDAQALALRLRERTQARFVEEGHGSRIGELLAELSAAERESSRLAAAKHTEGTYPTYTATAWGGGRESRRYDDLLTSASHELAELTERDELLRAACQTLASGAGVTGLLLFEIRDQQPVPLASAYTEGKEVRMGTSITIDPVDPEYPRSVVERALRAGTVVLPNALSIGVHTGDPYVLRHRPRSVLCVPIRRSEQVHHLVYMENRVMLDLFRPKLVEAITTVGTPLSIALRNAELFSSVQQSNGQLRVALEQATAADAAKMVFLENMSHELRTPLNGILGNATLLASTGLDAHQAALLQDLHGAGEALLNRIANILDFAQLSAGKSALHPSIFNLEDQLQGNLARFQFEARARQTQLALSNTVAADTLIRADEGRLERLVAHLLDNALKFSEARHVWLTCELEGSTAIRLAVKDDGVGIAPERLQRIFSFFEQGDAGSTKRVEGVGLGLATVKSIVALMKGRLEVRSTPNEGSSFELVLPVELAARPERAPQAAFVRETTAPRDTILIAEDSRMNMRIVERLVTRIGYLTLLCSDGAEAVAAYRANHGRIAFVLMDCQMPIMDGYDATRAIRQHERAAALQRCPIIAVTANALEGDRERCFEAGMDHFLSKPLRVEALHAIIEERGVA